MNEPPSQGRCRVACILLVPSSWPSIPLRSRALRWLLSYLCRVSLGFMGLFNFILLHIEYILVFLFHLLTHIVIYWACGLQNDAEKFMLFLVLGIAMSMCSNSLGIMVASVFSRIEVALQAIPLGMGMYFCTFCFDMLHLHAFSYTYTYLLCLIHTLLLYLKPSCLIHTLLLYLNPSCKHSLIHNLVLLPFMLLSGFVVNSDSSKYTCSVPPMFLLYVYVVNVLS